MIAPISGIGCVTPLGTSLDEIWTRIQSGETPEISQIKNPDSSHLMSVARIAPSAVAHLSREPRLRRASMISLLAAAAGKAALDDAQMEIPALRNMRFALVFGVSSGGVHYTRRFYEQVVREGAHSASPLLFPETVYNAPASHLAAILGIHGATYTLVGDGTSGMQALHFGAQLLATDQAEYVLVVAAEELDWILTAAHDEWRLLAHGHSSPHSRPRSGALLAEGAAAVLLGGAGRRGSARVHPGIPVFSKREAASAMDEVLSAFRAEEVDFIVDGANGTWTDSAVARGIKKYFPHPRAKTLQIKRHFGESLGCGALQQVVVAMDALKRLNLLKALVPSLGWNQLATAALIQREL